MWGGTQSHRPWHLRVDHHIAIQIIPAKPKPVVLPLPFINRDAAISRARANRCAVPRGRISTGSGYATHGATIGCNSGFERESLLAVSPMENRETVTFCDSTTNPENTPRPTLKSPSLICFPKKPSFLSSCRCIQILHLNFLGAVLTALGNVPGHSYIRTEYHNVLRHWSGSRQ